MSDGVRPRNATFFATTNVLSNVLEQLVDRLEFLRLENGLIVFGMIYQERI
jgi:hypothetical protein